MKKRSFWSQRGFTVAEMMVTVAAVGILLSAASATLGKLGPQFTLDNAARTAAITLNRAKTMAVTRGDNTFVWIGYGYCVVWTVDPDDWEWEVLYDQSFSQKIAVSGQQWFVFTPLGSTDDPGTLTLSNGQYSRNVTVGLIGEVDIQ
jgi:prepilin-type N-terminal cleavage/methylation domain-containing protein